MPLIYSCFIFGVTLATQLLPSESLRLGMTEISPQDMQREGYPLRAEWCGKSVCIGGEFQATGSRAVDQLNRVMALWKGCVDL